MIRNGKELMVLVRPEILDLKPYTCARDKVKEGILLDANENPFSRFRGESRINRYPDPRQEDLRRELSRFTGVSVSSLLAASGSDEVFDWLFKVFCIPGRDAVAVFEPTYGMYEVTAAIFGIPVVRFQLDEDFCFRPGDFLEKAGDDIKILFLCSPNNPTGKLVSREAVIEILENWDGVVVMDEAYLEFSGQASMASLVEDYPALVVTRTFSKAFGSAGIRLGYVVADAELINLFLKVKLPYNLSVTTQRAGIEALENLEEAVEQIGQIVAERKRLEKELEDLENVEIVTESVANFILIRCQRARDVYEFLFSRGVVIRDRGNQYGLENCLRVSIGTPEENNLFLAGLKDALEELEQAGSREC